MDPIEALDEIERLRSAIEAIRQATIEGRVCDDVAWFDAVTHLVRAPASGWSGERRAVSGAR